MKALPIRIRLTGTYLAVIFSTFLIFSFGMYFGVRNAIEDVVDRQLSERVENIRPLLSQLPSVQQRGKLPSPSKTPGPQTLDELCQISDTMGHLLYQTPAMKGIEVPIDPLTSRRHHRDRGNYTTISRRHSDIRVLSSTAEDGGEHYLIQVAASISPLYTVLYEFKTVAQISIPLLLLAAGIAGYWLSGRAMRPVHDLVGSARGISQQNLSQRLQVPDAQDELRELAETLNAMLTRLDAAFRRVTQFTADASHELRTPLTVIRTTAEVLLQKHRTTEEYIEMVSQILLESEATTVLVDNLLTLARADTNPAPLQLEPMDARALVRELEAGCQALAVLHELGFSVDTPAIAVTVLADKHSLRRLLLILIDNAIKYTIEGGMVKMMLRVEHGKAIFDVSDSGIGITAEDRPHIFERFYRAQNARYLNSDGAGLGLSIAQWITAAHHGTIEVASSLHEETVFRVTLPLP